MKDFLELYPPKFGGKMVSHWCHFIFTYFGLRNHTMVNSLCSNLLMTNMSAQFWSFLWFWILVWTNVGWALQLAPNPHWVLTFISAILKFSNKCCLIHDYGSRKIKQINQITFLKFVGSLPNLSWKLLVLWYIYIYWSDQNQRFFSSKNLSKPHNQRFFALICL